MYVIAATNNLLVTQAEADANAEYLFISQAQNKLELWINKARAWANWLCLWFKERQKAYILGFSLGESLPHSFTDPEDGVTVLDFPLRLPDVLPQVLGALKVIHLHLVGKIPCKCIHLKSKHKTNMTSMNKQWHGHGNIQKKSCLDIKRFTFFPDILDSGTPCVYFQLPNVL